jgi:hypothetical protein
MACQETRSSLTKGIFKRSTCQQLQKMIINQDYLTVIHLLYFFLSQVFYNFSNFFFYGKFPLLKGKAGSKELQNSKLGLQKCPSQKDL